MSGCGLPDVTELPLAPISTDEDSDTDNTLKFNTPEDTKIDRYIIWYKIYPFISRTTTQNLVTTDYDHFKDLSIRNAADIRIRDFHELELSENKDDGFYFRGIGTGIAVTISREPTDTTNYIKVSVAGGNSYNVRRDVPVSTTDSLQKPFYDKFNLAGDSDISTRRFSDFSVYGPLDKGFAVAFLAQSAYVDGVELKVLNSKVTTLGIIYSSDGFENN
ncbi:hypothetical protein P0082_00220 [Candidatus Haliotispira prima]|uniref:Lipoprotein n=1 Tax=Candidatus Haliotispira prima TaxID=3034016 RepID=A0ABY8MIX1_9SPIO|nr:hypothetical protein P0082_00220 [Candidatus Haliotispira prima]